MPVCPECGNVYASGDEFCRTCGTALPSVPSGQQVMVDSSPARGAPHHSSREHAAQKVTAHAPPHKPPLKLPSVPLPVLAGGLVLILLLIGAVWFFGSSGFTIPGAVKNISSDSPDSGSQQKSAGIPPLNGKCSEGLSLCSGSCVDFRTDPDNCGGCGFSVPFGETCINGKFSGTVLPKTTVTSLKSGNTSATAAGTQGSCPSGQTFCSGTCRNLLTDAASCGSCGHACIAGQNCQNGQCVPVPTATATATTSIPATLVVDLLCSGRETACGNACVDVFTDKKNCGVCGRACRDQDICMDGRCGPACAGNGTTLCNDLCIDLDTDIDNCGACGTECKTLLPNAKGSVCSGGECTLSGCKTDYADCDKSFSNGCEIYLKNDANNCGSCGKKCPSGQVCYNKKCTKPAT